MGMGSQIREPPSPASPGGESASTDGEQENHHIERLISASDKLSDLGLIVEATTIQMRREDIKYTGTILNALEEIKFKTALALSVSQALLLVRGGGHQEGRSR